MHATEYLSASSAPVRADSGAGLILDGVLSTLHRTAALILLLVFSPIMLTVAWMIWRFDGAPVLFGHYRVGQGGRLFRCLKFRTMRRDSEEVLARLLAADPAARAEWDRDQTLAKDPRITPIGRLLRKTSLDELPQLINVLRGEMRLVGPRPVTAPELRRYDDVRWHYVSVCPGITGLWQVSGRNTTSYAERIAMDRRYVETAGPLMDLTILFRTVWVVVSGHGAG